MSQNPLNVSINALLDYAAIEPACIEPAIDQLIDETRIAVEQAADPALEATWDTIIEPLEATSARLWRAWSAVGHLNAVVNTPELRAAYNACLPKVTEFSTWAGLHHGLYAQYRRLREAASFEALSPVRQRIIQLALRDFRLSGVELQGEQRTRYAEISDQQAQASQKFSENVLDSIDRWSLLLTDEKELAGLPADVVAAARKAAADEDKDGWKLTLKMPCYLPVMQYAESSQLRETLYRAYGTIASEHGDPALDNSSLIEQLLALRAEESQLLGYDSFSALRLETRMADTAHQVQDFLHDLAGKARPYAQRDLEQLRAFAREQLALENMQPWDTAFVSERLRQQRYNYSEEEVRQYFTEPRVLQGLFDVAQTLFGIRFEALSAPVWHADASAWNVLDSQGNAQGVLYLDLYARPGKQGGAWVDSERSRKRGAEGLETPIVYLTCNFTPPQDGRPALLTHDDVITLFHESGHALHALLSQIDEPAASPFASVEWDAIELPSQFMENFCWEWSVVQQLSSHVDTGEPLPRELYERMLAARNYQSGMQLLRQIEFSLFDMCIHTQAQGLSIQDVMAVLQDTRKDVAVLFPPEWHRFPHNFSHLFAGGYGAGYYSYKWAEVLSSDAFALFEEQAQHGNGNILDPVAGARFRDEILAVGGSRPAVESFEAFRGRPASIDALLRHSGMVAAA